jgi:hypothetical protein
VSTVNDIAKDLRGYADNAVTQGKQVLDAAQDQLSGYTGSANDLVGKTRDNVVDLSEKLADAAGDLRQSAEKAINVDALSTAVEPYVAQLREYTTALTDRVEGIVTSVREDKRVSSLVERAEPVLGAVADLAQEHIVRPVQSFTGWGTSSTPRRPTSSTASATTRPASTSTAPTGTASAAKPTKAAAKTTRRPAATKPAAKSTTRTAARKTAAKDTTSAS